MRDVGAGAPAGASVSPIAARLDRLPVSGLHWAIILVSALGLLFDVVEAALGNALSAVFSAPPHRVQPYQLSLLLASIFAGGAIGAPLIGWLADRRGRRLALVLSLAILTVTSLLAAASSDIAWLTVFRTLSGLALGAYPPLMAAYLADVLPPARRGMLILLAAAIGLLGAPGSLWAALGRTHRRRCVLLAALFFLSPWVTIGFPLLTGAVLIEKSFRLGDSLLLGVSMFGPAIGSARASESRSPWPMNG